ncbi:helix-turn-helix domain-containing protein [Rhodoferax sp.]|uniref:helix-turn-helix transcriptional regulator n=1 Tax=Rhodoferax sp. TaxID=50421 RepID=UPI00283EA7FB|nr:helix-turn-helix domain-containing protein [Rhodoferax sp.]MDR3369063.1 helix-turn-helix domain-containing protein [Rhodoferax sp.]
MTSPAPFRPMSKDEIADVLGVSARTVENWVNDGIVPAPKKLGNRVYWHPNVFYAWLDAYLLSDCLGTEVGPDVANAPQAKTDGIKQARHSKDPESATGEIAKLRANTAAKLAKMMK